MMRERSSQEETAACGSQETISGLIDTHFFGYIYPFYSALAFTLFKNVKTQSKEDESNNLTCVK